MDFQVTCVGQLSQFLRCFYPLPTWIGHRLYICCFGFTCCCFYCVLMYGCASPSHCFSLVRTLDQSPFLLFGCIYCLSLVSIWLYLVLHLLFSLSFPRLYPFNLDWTLYFFLFFAVFICFYLLVRLHFHLPLPFFVFEPCHIWLYL